MALISKKLDHMEDNNQITLLEEEPVEEDTKTQKTSIQEKEDSTRKRSRILYISSWLWFIIGAVITGLLIVITNGKTISEGRTFLGSNPHLFVYIELVSAGALQIIFMIITKDSWKNYGFNFNKTLLSLIPSILSIVAFWGFDWLITGSFWNIQSIEHNLSVAGRITYGLLGLIIWGPLEMFFFIWLVENAQSFFKRGEKNPILNKWFNLGLLLTLVLFSLAHFVTTQNWFNVVYVFAIFLILGEIYIHTGNIIGPMIAWTLINDQVWYMLQLLWVPAS
jgi:membrane protease YdiL (CAAX protease family)